MNIMTMLLNADPVLGKFQKHIEILGVRSKIPDEKSDFESDYKESHLLGIKEEIGSAGSLELVGSPIDYIHLIKKQ